MTAEDADEKRSPLGMTFENGQTFLSAQSASSAVSIFVFRILRRKPVNIPMSAALSHVVTPAGVWPPASPACQVAFIA
jgi:hypothetical protein